MESSQKPYLENAIIISIKGRVLGIYLEETIIRKDTCIPMFTAVILTTSKAW